MKVWIGTLVPAKTGVPPSTSGVESITCWPICSEYSMGKHRSRILLYARLCLSERVRAGHSIREQSCSARSPLDFHQVLADDDSAVEMFANALSPLVVSY